MIQKFVLSYEQIWSMEYEQCFYTLDTIFRLSWCSYLIAWQARPNSDNVEVFECPKARLL